ncbi:nuclear pore complex protein Nup205-like [Hetaerina americana]|uniref:nuclear pore complex protein Nup205-like n=1 Tax=Hetaerina americana TaxID=62018 RepID=UPI003A7F5BEA
MNESATAFPVKGEDDMWTPFKELQGIVEECISNPGQTNSLKRLEGALRKHKQNFITILKNPPKNSKCREELKHDGGSSFTGAPLAHDIVEEACVLSDMYDLNEFMALQLLMTAERQMPCHPGLPRGLVAVLLYYDGRAALAGALCTLVRARRGVTWDLHPDTSSSNAMEDGQDGQKILLTDYVTRYTEELAESGLLEHLIDLVECLDLGHEIERLHGGRALGGPRHRREVTHLFQLLKQTISDTIFFWAAQTGLSQRPLIRLIAYMKKVKEDVDNGILSNVNLTLTMAMLYAIDLGILHRKDDRDVLAKKLPLLSDKGVGQELLRCICPSSEEDGTSLEENWVWLCQHSVQQAHQQN